MEKFDVGILEDFIIELLRNNIIKDYTAERKAVQEFYINEFRSRAKCEFSKFFRDLWRLWYIGDFTKKYVYFDERWINYISKLERAQTVLNEKQLDEKTFIQKNSCHLCSVEWLNETQFDDHLRSFGHQARTKYLTNKSTFTQSADLSLNIVEANNVDSHTGLSLEFKKGSRIDATLHLTNLSKNAVNILEIIRINPLMTGITMTVNHEREIARLETSESIILTLNGYFENSTSFVYPIVIIAKYDSRKDAEYFLKEIMIEVTSEFSELKPTVPYSHVKKFEHATNISDELIIPGVRPKSYVTFYSEQFALLPYKIPPSFDRKLKELAMTFPSFIERYPLGLRSQILHKTFANFLGINPVLSENNYCTLLLQLVNVEENQMRVDIRDFDTVSILTFKGDNRYELEVPGLAEARPSLMINDSVYVKENKNNSCKYQGIVNDVLESSVILGFHRRFSSVFTVNKKFHIEFGFSRRPMRVEKQAIIFAREHNIVSYFYPKEEPKCIAKNIETINYFNPILNDEQKRAVKNILQERSVPYLIYGPPGTGKTVTLVEAILQIWKNQPQAKMLVCAPSNSATNEIALRLVDKIPSKDMFRLLGNTYGKDAKLSKLEKIINIRKDGTFYMPSVLNILQYRVVVTTLVTAARIVNGGVPDGHYSHVFIDESGYATESQSLIPMVGVLSSERNRGKVTGQIVLAGDPRQLGAVVHSKFAEDCGYGISMLERLLSTCKIYSRNENGPISYNEKYVTKLVRNYRSHGFILKTPNELFYHNELIPAGCEMSDLFTEWEHLRTPGFPMIFHHVVGESVREKNSPSFFNVQEIEEVVGYISKLVGTRVKGIQISQDQIGVITPYRKQVEKLRKACKKRQWDKILIGSVEQFQGMEKLIIIVSTVKSKNNHKFEEIDRICRLGFVKNPKRFNVAITRAKALLIVVGNGLVLSNDKNWLNLIQYCIDNKSVAGRAFSLSNNEYLNGEIPSGTSSGRHRQENDG